MEGNVLICVANVTHGEKLIKKGSKLANVFGVKCYVLTKEKQPYDVLDYDLVHRKVCISNLCKEYDVPYLFYDNEKRRFAKVVQEVAEKYNISHILIGQPMKQSWRLFGEGSIVNDLFVNLDEMDLHIVKVDKNQVNFNEFFEKGIPVTVYEVNGVKKFDLKKEESGQCFNGIFFQSNTSEFENGVLKISYGNEVNLYRVVDGEIKETIKEETLQQIINL